jgi:hypothetical protein
MALGIGQDTLILTLLIYIVSRPQTIPIHKSNTENKNKTHWSPCWNPKRLDKFLVFWSPKTVKGKTLLANPKYKSMEMRKKPFVVNLKDKKLGKSPIYDCQHQRQKKMTPVLC